jgi:hypothetical protein
VRAAGKVSLTFRELVSAHGEALAERYGVGARETWPVDPWTIGHAGPAADPHLAYVFGSKFDPSVLTDLFAAGVVTSRADDPRWIGMHPRLANVYMTALANELAIDTGARPITDSSVAHVAISGLTMQRLAAVLLEDTKLTQDIASDELEQVMASMAIQYVIPKRIEHIPTKQIIQFRNAHTEERTLFQDEVAAMIARLDHVRYISSPDEVGRHLENEYGKRLAPRVRRMRRDLRRANIDTAESALSVSAALPAGLAAAVAALSIDPSHPAFAVSGVGLSTWSLWRARMKSRDIVYRPSPEAYLVRIADRLAPREMVGDISKLVMGTPALTDR